MRLVPRSLLALLVLGLLTTVAGGGLLLTWDRTVPETTHAAGPGAGMSLGAPDTGTPTATPTPTQSPTPIPKGWLRRVNFHRAAAKLPPITQVNHDWSEGCWAHARYTVKNNVRGHYEEPDDPWYTAEGHACAKSANVWGSGIIGKSDEDAIDTWMQGPFHAVGILDPALLETAYGSYREADGGLQMGAALDVTRGLGSIPDYVDFPIAWPSDGTTTPLRRHVGERPSPLTSCPGYEAPTGLPVILQVGSGLTTLTVTSHSFMRDDIQLEHCVFDGTNYYHPDSSEQNLGRAILGARDAIVLIPREPLISGAEYRVSIEVNDANYSWSFAVSAPGDVNCDHAVTIADAQLIAQLIAGRIDALACPKNGDVNGSGEVTIADAQLIAQLIVGRIPSLPQP